MVRKIYRLSLIFSMFSLMLLASCSIEPLVKSHHYEKVNLPELRKQAGEAYRQGDYLKASQMYQKALDHNQDDAILAYNLACTYALQQDTKKAVYFVELAFRNGFRDLDLFLDDPDFNPIRKTNEFLAIEAELIQRFKAIGRIDYVEGRSLLPYRTRLPDNFSKSKSYPLLIGLHGNGGNADGFVSYYDEMDHPDLIYVAPEGQYRRSSSIGPMGHSRSWVLPGSKKSIWRETDKMVEEYILNVIKQVKSDYKISKVYLMGYSQGAVFAYTIGLQNPDRISGVIGLSGYLMKLDDPDSILETKDLETGKSLRIFMGHGSQDAAIRVERAHAVKALFEKYGYDLVYREFEGQHGINPDVLKEAIDWMIVE